mmetsp:Transcript_23324/g.59951  ORF Transcript_23324/g.59951 Transcript_23324/m.59951 type:complete len:261 (+) Transcript_23324:655-1437(+)
MPTCRGCARSTLAARAKACAHTTRLVAARVHRSTLRPHPTGGSSMVSRRPRRRTDSALRRPSLSSISPSGCCSRQWRGPCSARCRHGRCPPRSSCRCTSARSRRRRAHRQARAGTPAPTASQSPRERSEPRARVRARPHPLRTRARPCHSCTRCSSWRTGSIGSGSPLATSRGSTPRQSQTAASSSVMGASPKRRSVVSAARHAMRRVGRLGSLLSSCCARHRAATASAPTPPHLVVFLLQSLLRDPVPTSCFESAFVGL